MAGIYIHIPFCKQRCTYCDFYTEVAPDYIESVVNAIILEIRLRTDYLAGATVETIYFGGGTPSLLTFEQFDAIFKTIFERYNVAGNAEITFEANPDDLTEEFFQSIARLPFNRISIGIQSFDDADLKRINRRHTSIQAEQAVKIAQANGFDNISIDLIYGLPLQTMSDWERQLNKTFQLNVQHISAYGLTYEKGTALWRQLEKGKVQMLSDDLMVEMYEHLLNKMNENGFEAYEISNFALPGYRSRHNGSYWKMTPYLGVGPAAHSFDGEKSRQWNVSSMKKYVEALKAGNLLFEKEELTPTDQFNDYIMVSLRTSDGVNLEYLQARFGVEMYNYCLQQAEKLINEGKMERVGNCIKLTNSGIQISNLMIEEMMYV